MQILTAAIARYKFSEFDSYSNKKYNNSIEKERSCFVMKKICCCCCMTINNRIVFCHGNSTFVL